MAVLNRGFEYQPIIRPYVAAPVEAFKESLDERSTVFDKNIADMDQLDILASNIDVLDPDKELKLAEIDRIRKGLQEVSSVGAENATSIVRKMARDFAGNENLRKASEKYSLDKQRQEDIRQLRLKGITPLDFTSKYEGITKTPDWNPAVESANDFLIDAKKYVGNIKERFKDLGISFQQINLGDGVTRTIAVTGDGKEVTPEMLEERAGAVIDDFVKSPTGGNQFYRWSEFQGQDPREAARQMLLTAGLEQVGSQKDVNYAVVENDTYYRDLLRKKAEEEALQYTTLDNPSEIGDEVRGGDTFGNEAPVGWWDKTKLRLKASVDGEKDKVVSVGRGATRTVKEKVIDNSVIKDEVEPVLKKALRVANPNLSEDEINQKASQYFNSKDFVLDNPEVEAALKLYETSVRGTRQRLRLTQQSTLNSLERPIDKNFNADNITKDVERNIEQKTFFTIEDGKVVPYTDQMRALKQLSKVDPSAYKLQMDFAGIVDAENPFGMEDEFNLDPNQTFYQPYAFNIIDDSGKTRTVYASRSLNDRPYGTTEDKRSLMAMHEAFNKSNRSYGEYVPVKNIPIPGDIEVVAIPNTSGGITYKAKGTINVNGKSLKLETTDSYQNTRDLINHLIVEYNKQIQK